MVKNSARKNAVRRHMAETGRSYADAGRDLDRRDVTLDLFSGQAREVVEIARRAARGQEAVRTEHLLRALLDPRAGDLACEIIEDLAGEAVRDLGVPEPGRGDTPPYAPDVVTVLSEGAPRQADRTGHGYVGPEHILLALLARRDELGLTYTAVRAEVTGRLAAMGVVGRYFNPR